MHDRKPPCFGVISHTRPKLAMRAFVLSLLALSSIAGTGAAAPLTLTEAYRHAVGYDAQLKVANDDRAIYKEEVSKAVSAFLPNIRSSYSQGRNLTESSTPYTPYKKEYYNTMSSGLSLKQSIFNLGSIAAYRQAKAVQAKSESTYLAERSSLVVRTAEAYFNALFAEDSLGFARAQTAATLEQLQQAKKRYHDGFGTLTEASEAQASYDLALADEASSVAGVDFSLWELERVTGVYADELCRVSPSKLVLNSPEPANVDEWLALAESKNHKVNAARQEIVAAVKEVDKTRASRYPVIDLWAGKNKSQSENNYTIGSTYDTWSVSLQASLPLYTGGYTSAMVRQATARKMRASDEFDFQERSVRSDIRKYYNGQVNGIAQVKAYDMAVHSHEVALEGTRKGFLAGFRTNADVLDAQKKLLDSRRSLSKARYQYLLNSLMLKDAAGILDASDIDDVSRYFEASAR